MGRLLIQNKTHLKTIARQLASVLEAGDILLFFGDMGTGKTTFIQALTQALGSSDEVNSPTFTLANHYQGHYPIFHLDLYRLIHPEAILDLDIDAYFKKSKALTFIEWAERLPYLPTSFIKLTFQYADTPSQRWLTLSNEPAHSNKKDTTLF